MDEITKSVARNVRNGNYFRDAREWYVLMYLAPYTERSLLIVATLIIWIAAVVVGYSVYNSLPLVKEIPLIVHVADGLNYKPAMKPLGRESEDPQQALAEYVVRYYVENRENYDFDQIDKREQRIKNTSSKQVFKHYQFEMSINNPESPLLIYQNEIQRTIQIKSIHLHPVPGTYDGATVRFIATMEDSRTKEKVNETYEATLGFSLSDVAEITKNRQPLEFVVTEYSVQRLNVK